MRYIHEANNLNDSDYISSLIDYLKTLQEGRTKPDTKGTGGYIRESLDNIYEIQETKDLINQFFSIKRRDTVSVKFK